MKKIAFTFTFFFLITTMTFAQMFSFAKDKNRNNQIKSMVYKQWKFTPKWYYYSWSLSNLTGLGIHAGYVATDRRTIKQLTPTITSSTLSQSEWNNSQKSENSMYEHEMLNLADRTIDAEYLIKKEDFDVVKQRIGNEMNKFSSNNIPISTAQQLYNEYDRLTKNISIIQNSDLPNAKRRVAYQEIEAGLLNLNHACISLNYIYGITKNIKK